MNFRGFSLIELLITIAIIAVLATGAAIWFFGYQRQAELDSAAKNIINTLREAQARSVSGKDFKAWGVCFDMNNNKFILFRDDGAGCAGAIVKEENYLSSLVKISAITLDGGGSEIIFNRLNGSPFHYGNFGGNNTAIRLELIGASGVYKDIIVALPGRIDSQ